ncbi:SDR family NAD(P)-dependent oxidoreductase [Parahaliea aestuarii]|uniref:SDR family oxidoreductase n=1 Tax=Parahaliea aestuarii TaxID=1852021 RepID=A0A5C8ZWZ3_9GAMM|nr:SDR family oxidoreductase [Parahaliea aestuarii]TXS93103.1 SDR family oxidoreductase [Parahaliea aestuarii]
MSRLNNKVALVTGAGQIGNIGAAICEAFLREGAAGVMATDISEVHSGALLTDLRNRFGGERVQFATLDVSDPDQWATALESTAQHFGHLDILVNNAGIAIHGGIADTSLEDLRTVMAVNHDGSFIGTKACLPLLSEAHTRHAGGGVIINTVSMASYMPNANNIGYHVSKAAQRMLTLCAAQELGPQKIRVNSVHPGVTMTPLMRQGLDDYVSQGLWESTEAAEAALAAMNPLNMASQPQDTAEAFVYLASEEARFVTGAAICHDGGLGMRY